jgi:hypothetical protein
MLTVHVRVNDARSQKPTAVRLRITDGQGTYFAPLGRLTEFATARGVDVGGQVQLGYERFAYIDGICEVRLPAGTLHVEVHKGPEYVPLRREVVLGPGQIALRLAIERWTDWRARGWYAGDSRAHDMTPHAALLEGQAEDLAVVNLLARQRPSEPGRPGALSNILAFSGTQPALQGTECQVVVNTWNRHPILGTVSLLNCHRAVYPLWSGRPEQGDDWSVADWCDQCHRKRGLVVWSDGRRLSEEEPQGEALAAALGGKIDAFEITHPDGPEPEALELWYRLLGCGRRLTLVGGSGKDSNAVLLGRVRTYAQLTAGQTCDYSTWIEAVRGGRTFASNGPLLSLVADGQGPGAELAIPEQGRDVPVRVEAESAEAFDQVELLHNGEVVASKETSGNRVAAVIETDVSVTGSGWLAARCWGRQRLADGQHVFAHTSPVYLKGSGPAERVEEEMVAPLRVALERTCGWVQREARCPREELRGQLMETCQEGMRVLERLRQG